MRSIALGVCLYLIVGLVVGIIDYGLVYAEFCAHWPPDTAHRTEHRTLALWVGIASSLCWPLVLLWSWPIGWQRGTYVNGLRYRCLVDTTCRGIDEGPGPM